MPVFLQRMRLGLMSTSYFLEKVSSHPYVVQNFNRCEAIVKEAWNVLYYLEKHGSQGLSLNNIYIQPRIPHSALFALGGWSGEQCFLNSVLIRKFNRMIVETYGVNKLLH